MIGLDNKHILVRLENALSFIYKSCVYLENRRNPGWCNEFFAWFSKKAGPKLYQIKSRNLEADSQQCYFRIGN